MTENKVVQASRDIAADAATIFEQIADPAKQPAWDGNNNLRSARDGQRILAVGDVFVMELTKDAAVRDNHVVEFEERRRIAWKPAPAGGEQPGHLWRWELQPLDDAHTRVTHTYDWSGLRDEARMEKARNTTKQNLAASLHRLAELVEGR